MATKKASDVTGGCKNAIPTFMTARVDGVAFLFGFLLLLSWQVGAHDGGLANFGSSPAWQGQPMLTDLTSCNRMATGFIDCGNALTHEETDRTLPMTERQEAELVKKIERERIGMVPLLNQSVMASSVSSTAQPIVQSSVAIDGTISAMAAPVTMSATAPATYDVVGKWAAPMNWPVVPIFVSLLNDGRVLAFDSSTDASVDTTTVHNTTRVALWDPVSNVIKRADVNTGNELFCSGFSKLPDGRLMTAGGNIDRFLNGLNKTHVFDPVTDQWYLEATMTAPRWYPAVTPLSNGELLISGGGPATSEVRQTNGTLRALTSASQSVWAVREYPWLQTAPNGKVFYYGPQDTLGFLNTSGAGAWQYSSPRDGQYRSYGSTAMYDIGKILVTGGDGNNPTAHTIDINGQTPVVRPTGSMAYGRTQHNVTVLADGSVLVVGGNSTGELVNLSGAVYPVELWNPATGNWSTLSSMTYTRQYHSFALLMPDARVLVGGGGICGSCEPQGYHYMNSELFSPPYLFKRDGSNQLAARPAIVSAPDGINYAQAFSVTASTGTTIRKVALARPGSVTHSNNMEQRYIPLSFTQNGNTLKIIGPASANIAPPGRYMLFILDENGTPSVAKFIDVGVNASRPPMAQNWQQLPGLMHQVSVNSNGDAVAVSDSGAVFQWQNNNWTQINGQFSQISISADSQIWAVDQFGKIYRRDNGNWTNIAGLLNMVSAARNGVAWGVNSLNQIWRWTNGWFSLNGTLKQIAAGPNGTAWGVTTANEVYSWNGSAWTQRPGTMLQVSMGDDGAVWGIALDHTVWAWNGTSWTQKPGSLTSISVADANNVWGVDADGKVWRWISGQATIAKISSQPKVSGSSVSYTAVVTGATGLSYKWNFGDGTPETTWLASPAVSHSFALPQRYVVRLTVRTASGVESSSEFVQAIYAPHTTNNPGVSMNILYEAGNFGNRVWNVNPDNNTVTVINAAANVKIAEIGVGRSPGGIARAPDGTIWVTNREDATISVINAGTLGVVKTVSLPRASQPSGLVFAPSGSNGYVALEASGQVIKLDVVTGAITGTLAVGATPRHISIKSDGSKLYVSRFISPPVPGESTASPQVALGGGKVVVVNTATMTINGTINLKVSDRPDSSTSGRGLPNYLGPAVISPDGKTAWIPSKQDNIQRGALRNGLNLNFESTVRGIASRINLDTGVEDYAARMDFDNAGQAVTAAYDPTGSYLFVALENVHFVAVVDSYNGTELGRINVGRNPQGLALSGDGTRLYVNNFMDRSVDVYDLTKLLNDGNVVISKITTVNTVASERLSAVVLRGKQLFYDARDSRLARDGYISCSVCHDDGGHDGRVWDLTGFGEGLRNTIDLRGRAGMAHGLLHWSANFDEVQDFEGQIRNLAGGTGLMTDPEFTATADTLGTAKAGRSADLDALAAYVSSLGSFSESPNRNTDGTLTTVAMVGKSLFLTAGCGTCHSGDATTDSPANVNHDIGTIKASSGKRLGGALTGIDTPTLRDVWNTAPYLHDGSASTLEAAINAHSGTTLSGSGINLIADYLRQLGNDSYDNLRPLTATQSSTYIGAGPSRAIDGNMDGNFNNNSVTHTNYEANAWWQMDLGGKYALNQLALWNRTDCCANRLSNFYVFVSDTDLTGRSFSNILADSTIWRYQVSGQASSKMNIPISAAGRFVRVQLAGTDYLSLAEVKVTGTEIRQALPDLVVTSLSYSNGLFTSTIKNQGNVATPSGVWFSVGYYVDGVYKSYGQAVRNLAAGASVNILANNVPFVIPNGIHTIKAYVNDVSRFAELDTGNNQLAQTITVGSGDVTPPAVALTAPSAGATVSGTSVAITAAATDNVSVAGVQFKLDGINLGTEDTSAPYSINWDSTTAGTGSHKITAVARDPDGNTATSSPIVVTVNNTGTTLLPDVIVTNVNYSNGSFTSTIKNQGTAATPAGVWIGVSYFVDGVYKTYGQAVRNLEPGASATIAANIIPYQIASGTHSIQAYVDVVNRFAELNETNNTLNLSVTVP